MSFEQTAPTPPIPYKPVEELVIKDLETLKVISDPLRLQMLQLLTQHPRTVKDIAARLDMPATKLYYHINLLEKHALITVVDTRIVSGIVEKQYQTTALHFHVHRGLLSPGANSGDENLNRLLATLLDDTRLDIRRSAQAGIVDLSDNNTPTPMALMVRREVARLSPERAAEFHRRVRELMKEFVAEDPDPTLERHEQGYRLVTIWYPTTMQDE